MVKLFKLKKLQKFLSCLMAFAPPPPPSYYMQVGFIRNGKIIQIKEIAEIPVMPNGLCTPPPPPPPPPPHTHTHCPFGHNTLRYLYYNLFLGSTFTCPPCANDKWDKGIISWKPIQKLLRQRDCSKLYKMTE